METITITKTVQILFTGKDTRQEHILCKVDLKKLNWKLRKLQNEGMFVLGVYMDEVKSPSFEQKGALTGRIGEPSSIHGSEMPTLPQRGHQ